MKWPLTILHSYLRNMMSLLRIRYESNNAYQCLSCFLHHAIRAYWRPNGVLKLTDSRYAHVLTSKSSCQHPRYVRITLRNISSIIFPSCHSAKHPNEDASIHPTFYRGLLLWLQHFEVELITSRWTNSNLHDKITSKSIWQANWEGNLNFALRLCRGWSWVKHACLSKLVIIDSDNALAPNQCWLIVIWTTRNKIQWNSNPNSTIFSQESAFEGVVCEMVAMLDQPPRVNISRCINARRLLVGHRITCVSVRQW